jgi:hypothetical protein
MRRSKVNEKVSHNPDGWVAFWGDAAAKPPSLMADD